MSHYKVLHAAYVVVGVGERIYPHSRHSEISLRNMWTRIINYGHDDTIDVDLSLIDYDVYPHIEMDWGIDHQEYIID